MSSRSTADRLTSRARLARGLKYSTVGPVDVTRGVLGIGLNSASSSAARVRGYYRDARTAEAQRSRRRPRPWLLALAGAAVLGVGAVTFSIVRRSTQPEPSPLPPSVEVTPKP